MKKPSFQLLLFAITMLMLSTNVLSANIQRRTIRFVENYKQGEKSFIAQNLPKKVNRLSANKGNIVLIYDEGLPDSIVTSDNVYYKSNTQSHAIYAPRTFSQNESLCYLKQDNSLMSQTLGAGNIFLDIDNATVDILNSLGWDLPESGLSIECSDISENGIGSSYSSHTFSLTKSQNSITKYSWKFMLKDRSGNFVQISTSDTPQFTINKINNPDNYFININGDLEGRIECRYTVNGKETDAIPFSLSLELKPVIFSVDNVKVHRNDNDNEFTVSLDARYAGAEHIYLEVEEEYSSSLRNYMFNQPFFAHMTSGKISSLYFSWVTVLVTNEYGSAEHTIEFEPVYYDDSQMREDEESLSMVINADDEYNYIELSDISYQYEMFCDGQGKADCIGVLEMTINVPPKYYLVSFTKSRKHLEDSSQFRGIGVKTIYQNEGPTIHIVMDNISWGTYFRTQLLLNLEDRLLAPDFCVDDYMDPADLAIIKGQTEIAEVGSDVVAIAGKNGLIEIDTPCNIYLNVYSIDGKHIFGGDISGHYSLPVHGNLMVVQYTLNGKTVTKKISTL